MSTQNHNTLVIIPARGGSKRLPKKNTLSLLGKSLLKHSIDFAKLTPELFDKIVVSTDDDAIKKIALENNVTIINRPAHLATDTATTVSVLKHVLEALDEVYEHVILLQPTNPCRPDNLLQDAFKVYLESGSESLMTVSKSDKKLGKIVDGDFIPFNYTIGQRSQDLEPLFFENGLLYIIKTSLILKNKILGTNNYPYIVDHPFARIDIDTQNDFDLAEFILKKHESDVH